MVKMRILRHFVQRYRQDRSLDVCHCSSWSKLLWHLRLLWLVHLQTIKADAAGCTEQLREKDAEAKALRSMTHRMILTQEELVIARIILEVITQLLALICVL